MIPRRDTFRDIPLYKPAKKPCRVDLSDNLNLFGMPPAAERVLREATSRMVTHYPAGYAPDLKRAVATHAGVAVERVTTGCGSDGIIDSTIRAFLDNGDALAYMDPTFVMVPLYSRMNGVRPVPVRLTPDFDLDVDGLVATGAKVIYLCSPNNPTGTALSRAAVERVVERAPGIVLIDEAYAEFAPGPGFMDLARTRPNVLVTRTFSKAYGLAGMRVGWAVGSPELIAEVEKARGPYMHAALSEAMATAVLTEDDGWVKARVAEAVANRERLRAELEALGLKPLPAEGNFLMVPLPGAPKVAERMRERDVNVRAFGGLNGVGDALRIGSGPWPLLEAALVALRESLR